MTLGRMGGHGRSRALGAALVLTLALVVPAAAVAARTVYVTDIGGVASVSQFSVGASGLLTALTPALVPASNFPEPMALSPDGRSLYVGNRGTTTVSQYDVDAGGHLTPKTPPTVATGATPTGLAVSPNGASAYVVNRGADTVSMYDVDAAGRLVPKTPFTVPAGTSPWGIALSPDGRNAYVANEAGIGVDGSVLQYDVDAAGLLTAKAPAELATTFTPYWPVVSPDGRSLYVSLFTPQPPPPPGSPALGQYDIGADGKLTAKNPPTVTGGLASSVLAVSPNGRSVYLTDSDGSVFQYDVGAGGVLTAKSTPSLSLGAGRFLGGVAVSPDSASVYAADDTDGATAVFQLNADAAGLLSPKTPPSVTGGPQPDAVAISPDQSPTAAFTGPASAAVGQAVAFDGSASSDPDGTVARYDWDFGDGIKVADAGAKPTHAFGGPGTFTVRLTVTDNEGCSTAFIFTGQTASCNGGAGATTTHAVAVAAGPGGPGATTTAAITRLRLSTRSFHAAKRGGSIVAARRIPVGTTISYRDSQAARTTFTVLKPVRGVRRGGRCRAPRRGQRGGKRCTRYISVGTFAHTDVAGVNRFKFTGRVRRHALKRGSYRLSAVAKVGTRSGRAVTTSFRIV